MAIVGTVLMQPVGEFGFTDPDASATVELRRFENSPSVDVGAVLAAGMGNDVDMGFRVPTHMGVDPVGIGI